ncbi:MAG: hypothetical protein U0R44_00040 [Candidatus Micrarchaeia archaeon]
MIGQLRDPSPQARLDAIRTLTRYLEANLRPLTRSDIDERFFPVLKAKREMERTLGSEIDIRFFPVLLFQRLIQIQEALRGLAITDPDESVRTSAQDSFGRIQGLLSSP